MNSLAEKTWAGLDTKVKLSTIWIFAMLNYLYCDVVGLLDPVLLRQYLTGNANGIEITPGFLLAASILMEIPIAMVLLSRVLKYRVNRWVNIIAGTIMTVVVVATLTFGATTGYYYFFSVIEIASTALIVWYAWKWPRLKAGENSFLSRPGMHETDSRRTGTKGTGNERSLSQTRS